MKNPHLISIKFGARRSLANIVRYVVCVTFYTPADGSQVQSQWRNIANVEILYKHLQYQDRVSAGAELVPPCCLLGINCIFVRVKNYVSENPCAP